MKKSIINILSIAFAMVSLTACQEEINNPTANTEATHTVVFSADQVVTKTALAIDGTTVHYSWKSSDAEGDKFSVFENGVQANLVLPEYNENDETMTISATFPGEETPANAKYIAHFNTGVKASQYGDGTDYDQASDVMISAEAEGNIDDGLKFSFKRVSAFGQVTLKNLAKGDYVSSVTFESPNGAVLAAEYDFANDQFNATGSSSITIESMSVIENGQAVVRFSIVPVENTILKVTVVTSDENKYAPVAVYEKTFASGITFSAGNLRAFGVQFVDAPYEDPHANDNGWYLVEDVRALNNGDVIRIACGSCAAVASAIGTGKFFTKVEGIFDSDNKSLNAPDAIDITLGKNGIGWTLLTTEGYVMENVTDLKVSSSDADDPTTWAISISDSDNSAIIAILNSDPINRILYNKTSPRFKTYTSTATASMLLPQIYKKYGTPEEGKVKQQPEISFSPNKYEYTIGDDFEAPVLACESTGDQSWKSSNTEVATVASDGTVTVIATGKTTITVTVAETDDYLEGSASYELTVKEAPVISGDKYILVSTVSDLAVGDKVIIAAKDSDFAMSTNQASSNRTATAITKNNSTNSVNIDSNVQVFELSAGNKTGTFAFKTPDGYLYASSSSSNQLKTQSNLTDNSSWEISISSGSASIIAQGSYTRNVMRYNPNNGNPIFACYASATQNDISIYKLDDGKQNQTLSFGNETEYTVYTGDTFTAPTLSGLQTTATYSSSNTDVATVDSSTGAISIVGAGTTTITATAAASDTYRTASASYKITVIAAYASLAELVADGEPTGATVKVTITDAVITGFYQSGDYRNGVFIDVALPNSETKSIEIYCRDVPAHWMVGGKITATIECPWKNYNSTWELCPSNWSQFNYTAPESIDPVDATWSVDPEEVTVKAGATATVSIITNYDGQLTVATNDANKATATISGKTITVEGVAAGTTALTITGAATSLYNAINKTIDVTVTEDTGGQDSGEDKDIVITSGEVVTNSGYAAYNTKVDTRDWVITFGGNNKSVGTNSGNRSKCNLSDYSKYAVSPVTTSDVASAFACKTKLDNVKKIKYTFNGGSNQANTNVYLIYSADGNTFSQISLTKGTQGAAISSGTEFEFTKCSGYFAVLFKATNSSGNWRIDDVNLTITYEE